MKITCYSYLSQMGHNVHSLGAAIFYLDKYSDPQTWSGGQTEGLEESCLNSLDNNTVKPLL